MRAVGAIFKKINLLHITMRTYWTKKQIKLYWLLILKDMEQAELHEFEAWVKKHYTSPLLLELLEHYIHGVYHGFNHAHMPLDFNEMKALLNIHKKWKNGNDAVWITISPDHLNNPMKFTVKTLQRVEQFCLKWFDPKRYSFYHWVIEAGENEQDPHLHVHALVQFKHKSFAKNHARDLKNFWAKKTYNSLKGKDYHSQNISGIYIPDKRQYMDDCAKGSHENFCVDPFEYLGIGGCYQRSQGVLS